VTAMGLFSKDIKNMDDLFVHTLRDIYYAEKQIVKSLPEMIEKANTPQLKQRFQTHLRETENHVKRLEQVFDLIGKKAQGVDCPAIDVSKRLRTLSVKFRINPYSMPR
jgi:ferritin-like metal-binding protein YciE